MEPGQGQGQVGPAAPWWEWMTTLGLRPSRCACSHVMVVQGACREVEAGVRVRVAMEAPPLARYVGVWHGRV